MMINMLRGGRRSVRRAVLVLAVLLALASTAAAGAGCAAGTGTCAVTPTVAVATGKATWWVMAVGAGGDGAWSAGSAFTVSVVTLPAPRLLGPAGTVTSATPAFSWAAVATATS